MPVLNEEWLFYHSIFLVFVQMCSSGELASTHRSQLVDCGEDIIKLLLGMRRRDTESDSSFCHMCRWEGDNDTSDASLQHLSSIKSAHSWEIDEHRDNWRIITSIDNESHLLQLHSEVMRVTSKSFDSLSSIICSISSHNNRH